MNFYEKYNLTTSLEKRMANLALHIVKQGLDKGESINLLSTLAASYPKESEDYTATLRLIRVIFEIHTCASCQCREE